MQEQSKVLWIWVSLFFFRVYFLLFLHFAFLMLFGVVAIVELRHGKSTWANERIKKETKTLSLPFSVICARQFRLCCSISHTKWVFFMCGSHFLIVIRFKFFFRIYRYVALYGVTYIESVQTPKQTNEEKNMRSKYSSENNSSPFEHAYQWRGIKIKKIVREQADCKQLRTEQRSQLFVTIKKFRAKLCTTMNES